MGQARCFLGLFAGGIPPALADMAADQAFEKISLLRDMCV